MSARVEQIYLTKDNGFVDKDGNEWTREQMEDGVEYLILPDSREVLEEYEKGFPWPKATPQRQFGLEAPTVREVMD